MGGDLFDLSLKVAEGFGELVGCGLVVGAGGDDSLGIIGVGGGTERDAGEVLLILAEEAVGEAGVVSANEHHHYASSGGVEGAGVANLALASHFAELAHK